MWEKAAAGLTSVLAAAVMLVACGSTHHHRTATHKTTGCPKSQRASCGRLIVGQRYVDGFFTEGAVTGLSLTGARKPITLANLERNIQMVSTSAPAGRYRLRAAVRPCDANCSHLDPAIRCSARLGIAARETTTATVIVRARPRLGCQITSTPARLTARPVTIAGVVFVSVPPIVGRECRQTANAVGYAVPCPTLLPRGLTATPRVQGCLLGIVGAGGGPHCARSWRGWIVGSSQVCSAATCPEQHLVVLGAPRIVRNPARAIDGPGMFPGSHVQPRGLVRVDGRLTHWYFVPPSKNPGSAFADHLVLVWTAGGHTYAYGFHVVHTFAEARALDLELVRHLVTVRPHAAR